MDAYLFTSESDHFKKLGREAITRDVNKVMRLVFKQLPGQPNVITVLELAILHSYGKIRKISTLSNKALVIES